MQLLIDTQVFIWLINEDKRLGKQTLELLNNPKNQVCISYFSFFEMEIKASIGKLKFDSSVLDDLPAMDVSLILPDVAVLRYYKVFNSDNKDPFDNALLAVALHEKCTLVTSDPKILQVSTAGLRLHDARV